MMIRIIYMTFFVYDRMKPFVDMWLIWEIMSSVFYIIRVTGRDNFAFKHAIVYRAKYVTFCVAQHFTMVNVGRVYNYWTFWTINLK